MNRKSYSGVLLISPERDYILQRRDQAPGIQNPGLIGIFGGRAEQNETEVACAIRELREELDLLVSADDLVPLLQVDMAVRNDLISCTIFVLDNVQLGSLTLMEGAAIEILSKEAATTSPNLSPLCLHVIVADQQRECQKE